MLLHPLYPYFWPNTVPSVLCWSADAQHLAIYTHPDEYERVLLPVTLKITVAWGWLMFTINTALTGLIIWKIVWVLSCCV